MPTPTCSCCRWRTVRARPNATSCAGTGRWPDMMAILDLLAAFALLAWGGRQLHGGLRDLAGPLRAAILAHAHRGRHAAFAAGLAGGMVQPAERNRAHAVAHAAAAANLPLPLAYAVLLGANLGGALALLPFALAPAWAFQVLAVAGAAASLLTRHARLRPAGRALFGAALVLLALQVLALAAGPGGASPLGLAIAAGLQQDALLAVTVGALIVLCLRSVFAALLVVAATGSAWLVPGSAWAVLLGVQAGAAILAYAEGAGTPPGRRLAAGHLLCTVFAVAAGLLLLEDLSRLLAATSGAGLLLLHAGLHGGLAAACLHLAAPLARRMERWLPDARPDPTAPAPAGAGLHLHDLEVPARALAGATREVMRVAELVEGMLRVAREAFLTGDTAAVESVRATEERVDALYLSLKLYLAQVPRRPLDADEQLRWEELMAFLIAAEQAAGSRRSRHSPAASRRLRARRSCSARISA
ncbi:MAG: Na/Pi cotransporter family protein, partial [Comamonadaceae bacterium]